jgi:hypothetical protein
MQKKKKVIIGIVLIYILAFGGLMAKQAQRDVLGNISIGVMFILGGLLGLYTKSITFLPIRNTSTKQSNYYGDGDFIQFIGIFLNGLFILIGLVVIGSIFNI